MRAPVKNMKHASAARLGLVACAMKASIHDHVAGVLAFLVIGYRVTRMRGQSSCSAAWLIMAWVGTMAWRLRVAGPAVGESVIADWRVAPRGIAFTGGAFPRAPLWRKEG